MINFIDFLATQEFPVKVKSCRKLVWLQGKKSFWCRSRDSLLLNSLYSICVDKKDQKNPSTYLIEAVKWNRETRPTHAPLQPDEVLILVSKTSSNASLSASVFIHKILFLLWLFSQENKILWVESITWLKTKGESRGRFWTAIRNVVKLVKKFS